ncbi:hypothetical protein SFRURICE_006486, partial [Spodoptera frugiperda]
SVLSRPSRSAVKKHVQFPDEQSCIEEAIEAPQPGPNEKPGENIFQMCPCSYYIVPRIALESASLVRRSYSLMITICRTLRGESDCPEIVRQVVRLPGSSSTLTTPELFIGGTRTRTVSHANSPLIQQSEYLPRPTFS